MKLIKTINVKQKEEKELEFSFQVKQKASFKIKKKKKGKLRNRKKAKTWKVAAEGIERAPKNEFKFIIVALTTRASFSMLDKDADKLFYLYLLHV